MQAFTLAERDLPRGCRDIRVYGELDLAVAEQLHDALDRAARERDRVLINLEGCEVMDSTGIAVIVRAHAKRGEHGGELAVYGLSSQVRRIFTVTGLIGHGFVFDDAEKAIAACGDPGGSPR